MEFLCKKYIIIHSFIEFARRGALKKDKNIEKIVDKIEEEIICQIKKY